MLHFYLFTLYFKVQQLAQQAVILMSSRVTMGPVYLRATDVIVFITVVTKVMKKDVQIMKVLCNGIVC